VETDNVVDTLFVGLTRMQGSPLHAVPWLASGWTVSDGGRLWTFTLRSDAKWSNGQAITAGDVRYSILRAMKPSTASYYGGPFGDWITGGYAYNFGRGPASAVGVTAPDAHTVVFHLTQPVPWFAQLLANPALFPVPQAVVEAHGKHWTDRANIVTDGPFTLVSNSASKIVLDRNPDYFDAADVTLTRVVLNETSSGSALLSQYRSGAIDVVTPAVSWGSSRNAARATQGHASISTSSSDYLYFNTRVRALSKPAVRRQFALAIDRRRVVAAASDPAATALGTIIPPVLPGFPTISRGAHGFLHPSSTPKFAQIKRALHKLRWNPATKLNLYFASDSSTAGGVMHVVQSDLARVGVHVVLNPVPGDVMQQSGIGVSPVSPKVSMVYEGWADDYMDAQDYFQLFTCGNVNAGLNAANYCNRSYDSAFASASRIMSDPARYAAYAKLEGRLTGPTGAMPVAPLYSPHDEVLVHPYVRGLHFGADSLWFLEGVSVNTH
jgi:oligopeptide transport system substrate-binding protein